MGIYRIKRIYNNTILGIWEIEEDLDWYISRVRLNKHEQQILMNYKNEYRKLQWLSKQLLLKDMLKNNLKTEIIYDKNGKPSLSGSPYEISISHSKKFVAILLSKKYNPGIDIELINPKIERIAKKFMNPEELKLANSYTEQNKIKYIHIVWGAKESLYKLYGKRNLLFIENLITEPFECKQKGVFNASISIGKIKQKYSLTYEKVKGYMLVYVLGESNGEW